MAKIPTNLAGALSCATKIQQGKSCTNAEMKATITILKQSYTALRNTARRAKQEVADKQSMIDKLLARIGV